MTIQKVEFIMNCFERNYESVLFPGFIRESIAQHSFLFEQRTLLINNVDNRYTVQRLAEEAVQRNEIDRFIFVEDYVEDALRNLGIPKKRLGRYLHWSDCLAVAISQAQCDYLVYSDVDLNLHRAFDWISIGLTALSVDPRILVVNPMWVEPDGFSSAYVEADEVSAMGLIGYGFTDQVFLARTRDLKKRLLPRLVPLAAWVPATLRWNWSSGGLFLEQIIDGYMRRHHQLRLTIDCVFFTPIPMSTYEQKGLIEYLHFRLSKLIVRFLNYIRLVFPRLIKSPRFRMTGLLDPKFQKNRKGALHILV